MRYMAKHHRKRNYSKKSTKNHQKATLEPPKAPEPTEEELYESYRKNTRKAIWGIAGIFLLVLALFILIAVDVSGCQFVETEEEFENCQSYSLLEKILYGGTTPIEESSEGNTEESSDDQADERLSDSEENINQEEN